MTPAAPAFAGATNPSEQLHLSVPFRRPEQVAAERREAAVHAMFARGALDTGADELRPNASPFHAGKILGVIVAAAANVLPLSLIHIL